MSVKALFWALEQRIPTNPKVVLIYLSDWFNELEDCAWPSLEQLVQRTGLSKSTVQRAIVWLIENELVVIEHRFKGGWQKSNRFRLPIGVICLQGSQSDHPTLVTVTTPDSHSDHPVEHTIKDTVKDTINLASSPTQGDDVKISDVIETNSKTKKSIFEKFKPTPKGCADFWRDARATAADDNGFAAELLVKDFKMLDNARKRVGADFTHILWKVMEDWVSFAKHAEAHTGAYKLGLNPTVSKFCLQIEAAADYYQQNKPVKLIAQPLTKQPAPCTPIPKVKKPKEPAITLSELLAMNKDDE